MPDRYLVDRLADWSDEDLDALLDSVRAERQVRKATLDAAARNALPDSAYAYIDSSGGRHLPVNDAAHVRAAMGRFNQTAFESPAAKARARAKIRAAAKRLGIAVSDDANVSKADFDAIMAEDDQTAVGVYVAIDKAAVDITEGIIYGVASVAEVVDREGDVIPLAELRKAAHEFLYNPRFNDTHGANLPGRLVESWLTGTSWHIGLKPDDIAIAHQAARGEWCGFSIEGEALRVPA